MSNRWWDRLMLWFARRRLEHLPCDQGGWQHSPLVWERNSARLRRSIASQNQACEIMVASGFAGMAAYIGVCPRCKQAVEWSTSKPS